MIKLSEAILQDKLKPGGKFGPTDYGFISMDSTGCLHWEDGKDKESVIMCKEHMELEGEIIPAEPKVMTAEEYLKTIEEKSEPDCHRCWIQGNRKGFEDGHKNGRLEMWLEFKKRLLKGLVLDRVKAVVEELKPE